MLKHMLLLVFFLSALQTGTGFAQTSDTKCEGLFCSEEPLDLQLELYFDSLLAGGTSERARYSASLKILNNKKITHTFHVQLSKRGHFRKFPNICDFPPLRIHFDQQETKGTEFADLNKIKIVIHCQNNDTAFEQYVIQEHLIYKAYNVITPYSFKTRLARIRYVDLSKTFPDVQTFTFFIENPGALETRLNGVCLDVKYVWPENLDRKQYALMTMFQYMMINQDWSVSLAHNVEIFAEKTTFRMLPIPFDFDMCGVIAIPYKSPTIPFKKGEKPMRQFLGKNISQQDLADAINVLRKHKNEIVKVFNTSPYITPENRTRIINHLSEFYMFTEDVKNVSEFLEEISK
jgi:hypothetical protein